MNKCWFLLFALLVLFSCSEDEDGGTFTPANYAVKGRVEKGPFVKGSIVTLQPLDGKLNPLGTSFTGNIIDNEGSFDFGTLKLDAPYALLTTDGYFFNEVAGGLSRGEITLQAVVNLADNSTVNVNLLTHLSKERIKKLVADGASFSNANKQAQKELLTNFGLQKYADTDVSRFSITSGTNEAAALIMVSSALLYDRSEAELTEAIAEVSAEFTAEGALSEAVKNEYRSIAMKLPYQRIAENIIERYQDMGKEVVVKDLSYYVDWDNDGVAGNEFNESGDPLNLKFETDNLNLPIEGGTAIVKIIANGPYSLTNFLDDDIISPESSGFYKQSPVSYEKNVDQHVLTIKVAPASSFLMKNEAINLYSVDGKIHSTLVISQAGDPAKIENVLSYNAKDALTGLGSNISMALSYLRMMDALYTKSYPKTSTGWDAFLSSPVDIHNDKLNDAWANDYRAIQGIKRLAAIADPTLPSMAPYFTCMEAALYFEMAVMWENVLFIDKPYDISLPSDELQYEQCTSKKLFSQLEDKLTQGIERFFNLKNTFDTSTSYFLISRDVPRALLAKMYLYQKEYGKAYALFEAICKDKHYQLDPSRKVAMSKNSREMIYALPANNYDFNIHLESDDYFMPIVTYTEVLLSMAECAYQLKNDDVANDCLNQVLKAKGVEASEDFMTSLHKVWTSELKGTGTYFAFLKRNELAEKQLNMKSPYYLILPIPAREASASYITQNPGY